MTRPDQGDQPRPLGRRSILTKAMIVAGAVVAGSSSDAFATTEYMDNSESLDLNNAHVDLTIDSTKSSFAIGSIGGKSAVFKGSPYGGGVVKASLVGTSAKAGIAQKDQIPQRSNYVTTTQVSGSFGSTPVKLDGMFTVGSNFLFKYGSVTGKAASKPVKVSVLPLKNATSSSAVTVAGEFGGTKFSLMAIIPVGGRGSVSGRVAAKSVHLDILPLESDQLSIRLAGKYSGPSDLLALIVGGRVLLRRMTVSDFSTRA
jgi:hypothetical protein